MDSMTNSLALHPFLVRLGHNQITVVCQNAAEAIMTAKKQFCSEFPRLWDVINTMAENKFEVKQLDQ